MEGQPVEVGIRDLRNHLSEYLDKVRRGQEVVVTDRGRAVARMLPLSEERRIDQLVAEGAITAAPQKSRSRPRRRIESTESVSRLVSDQRR